jgi:hypothetical protein
MPNTVGSPAYVAEAPEYLRIRGLEAARDRSMDELSREFAAQGLFKFLKCSVGG